MRPGERYVILLIGDALAASLALFGALYFWASARTNGFTFPGNFETRPKFWFYLLPLAWLIILVELYDVHRANRRRETVRGVSMAALLSLGVYLPIFFIFPDTLPRLGGWRVYPDRLRHHAYLALDLYLGLHCAAVHAPGADHRGWPVGGHPAANPGRPVAASLLRGRADRR